MSLQGESLKVPLATQGDLFLPTVLGVLPAQLPGNSRLHAEAPEFTNPLPDATLQTPLPVPPYSTLNPCLALQLQLSHVNTTVAVSALEQRDSAWGADATFSPPATIPSAKMFGSHRGPLAIPLRRRAMQPQFPIQETRLDLEELLEDTAPEHHFTSPQDAFEAAVKSGRVTDALLAVETAALNPDDDSLTATVSNLLVDLEPPAPLYLESSRAAVRTVLPAREPTEEIAAVAASPTAIFLLTSLRLRAFRLPLGPESQLIAESAAINGTLHAASLVWSPVNSKLFVASPPHITGVAEVCPETLVVLRTLNKLPLGRLLASHGIVYYLSQSSTSIWSIAPVVGISDEATPLSTGKEIKLYTAASVLSEQRRTLFRAAEMELSTVAPLQGITVECWCFHSGHLAGQQSLWELRGESTVARWSVSLVQRDGLLLLRLQQAGEERELLLDAAVSGKWVHLALIISAAGAVSTWCNGSALSMDSRLAVGPALSGSARLQFTSSNSPLHRLAEVRLWRVARNPFDIARTWDRSVNPGHPHLLTYWTLAECVGAHICDRTGNAQPIRLPGADLWRPFDAPLKVAPTTTAHGDYLGAKLYVPEDLRCAHVFIHANQLNIVDAGGNTSQFSLHSGRLLNANGKNPFLPCEIEPCAIGGDGSGVWLVQSNADGSISLQHSRFRSSSLVAGYPWPEHKTSERLIKAINSLVGVHEPSNRAFHFFYLDTSPSAIHFLLRRIRRVDLGEHAETESASLFQLYLKLFVLHLSEAVRSADSPLLYFEYSNVPVILGELASLHSRLKDSSNKQDTVRLLHETVHLLVTTTCTAADSLTAIERQLQNSCTATDVLLTAALAHIATPSAVAQIGSGAIGNGEKLNLLDVVSRLCDAALADQAPVDLFAPACKFLYYLHRFAAVHSSHSVVPIFELSDLLLAKTCSALCDNSNQAWHLLANLLANLGEASLPRLQLLPLLLRTLHHVNSAKKGDVEVSVGYAEHRWTDRFETPHPCTSRQAWSFVVPGAARCTLSFDRATHLNDNADVIVFSQHEPAVVLSRPAALRDTLRVASDHVCLQLLEGKPSSDRWGLGCELVADVRSPDIEAPSILECKLALELLIAEWGASFFRDSFCHIDSEESDLQRYHDLLRVGLSASFLSPSDSATAGSVLDEEFFGRAKAVLLGEASAARLYIAEMDPLLRSMIEVLLVHSGVCSNHDPEPQRRVVLAVLEAEASRIISDLRHKLQAQSEVSTSSPLHGFTERAFFLTHNLNSTYGQPALSTRPSSPLSAEMFGSWTSECAPDAPSVQHFRSVLAGKLTRRLKAILAENKVEQDFDTEACAAVLQQALRFVRDDRISASQVAQLLERHLNLAHSRILAFHLAAEALKPENDIIFVEKDGKKTVHGAEFALRIVATALQGKHYLDGCECAGWHVVQELSKNARRFFDYAVSIASSPTALPSTRLLVSELLSGPWLPVDFDFLTQEASTSLFTWAESDASLHSAIPQGVANRLCTAGVGAVVARDGREVQWQGSFPDYAYVTGATAWDATSRSSVVAGYFEVRLVAGTGSSIKIGVCDASKPASAESVVCLTGDGCRGEYAMLRNGRNSEVFAPPLSVGDIIGCGIFNSMVFFTKNGLFLGSAELPDGHYQLCVGSSSPRTVVVCNLGHENFLFQLESLVCGPKKVTVLPFVEPGTTQVAGTARAALRSIVLHALQHVTSSEGQATRYSQLLGHMWKLAAERFVRSPSSVSTSLAVPPSLEILELLREQPCAQTDSTVLVAHFVSLLKNPGTAGSVREATIRVLERIAEAKAALDVHAVMDSISKEKDAFRRLQLADSLAPIMRKSLASGDVISSINTALDQLAQNIDSGKLDDVTDAWLYPIGGAGHVLRSGVPCETLGVENAIVLEYFLSHEYCAALNHDGRVRFVREALVPTPEPPHEVLPEALALGISRITLACIQRLSSGTIPHTVKLQSLLASLMRIISVNPKIFCGPSFSELRKRLLPFAATSAPCESRPISLLEEQLLILQARLNQPAEGVSFDKLAAELRPAPSLPQEVPQQRWIQQPPGYNLTEGTRIKVPPVSEMQRFRLCPLWNDRFMEYIGREGVVVNLHPLPVEVCPFRICTVIADGLPNEAHLDASSLLIQQPVRRAPQRTPAELLADETEDSWSEPELNTKFIGSSPLISCNGAALRWCGVPAIVSAVLGTTVGEGSLVELYVERWEHLGSEMWIGLIPSGMQDQLEDVDWPEVAGAIGLPCCRSSLSKKGTGRLWNVGDRILLRYDHLHVYIYVNGTQIIEAPVESATGMVFAVRLQEHTTCRAVFEEPTTVVWVTGNTNVSRPAGTTEEGSPVLISAPKKGQPPSTPPPPPPPPPPPVNNDPVEVRMLVDMGFEATVARRALRRIRHGTPDNRVSEAINAIVSGSIPEEDEPEEPPRPQWQFAPQRDMEHLRAMMAAHSTFGFGAAPIPISSPPPPMPVSLGMHLGISSPPLPMAPMSPLSGLPSATFGLPEMQAEPLLQEEVEGEEEAAGASSRQGCQRYRLYLETASMNSDAVEMAVSHCARSLCAKYGQEILRSTVESSCDTKFNPFLLLALLGKFATKSLPELVPCVQTALRSSDDFQAMFADYLTGLASGHPHCALVYDQALASSLPSVKFGEDSTHVLLVPACCESYQIFVEQLPEGGIRFCQSPFNEQQRTTDAPHITSPGLHQLPFNNSRLWLQLPAGLCTLYILGKRKRTEKKELHDNCVLSGLKLVEAFVEPIASVPVLWGGLVRACLSSVHDSTQGTRRRALSALAMLLNTAPITVLQPVPPFDLQMFAPFASLLKKQLERKGPLVAPLINAFLPLHRLALLAGWDRTVFESQKSGEVGCFSESRRHSSIEVRGTTEAIRSRDGGGKFSMVGIDISPTCRQLVVEKLSEEGEFELGPFAKSEMNNLLGNSAFLRGRRPGRYRIQFTADQEVQVTEPQGETARRKWNGQKNELVIALLRNTHVKLQPTEAVNWDHLVVACDVAQGTASPFQQLLLGSPICLALGTETLGSSSFRGPLSMQPLTPGRWYYEVNLSEVPLHEEQAFGFALCRDGRVERYVLTSNGTTCTPGERGERRATIAASGISLADTPDLCLDGLAFDQADAGESVAWDSQRSTDVVIDGSTVQSRRPAPRQAYIFLPPGCDRFQFRNEVEAPFLFGEEEREDGVRELLSSKRPGVYKVHVKGKELEFQLPDDNTSSKAFSGNRSNFVFRFGDKSRITLMQDFSRSRLPSEVIISCMIEVTTTTGRVGFAINGELQFPILPAFPVTEDSVVLPYAVTSRAKFLFKEGSPVPAVTDTTKEESRAQRKEKQKLRLKSSRSSDERRRVDSGILLYKPDSFTALPLASFAETCEKTYKNIASVVPLCSPEGDLKGTQQRAAEHLLCNSGMPTPHTLDTLLALQLYLKQQLAASPGRDTGNHINLDPVATALFGTDSFMPARLKELNLDLPADLARLARAPDPHPFALPMQKLLVLQQLASTLLPLIAAQQRQASPNNDLLRAFLTLKGAIETQRHVATILQACCHRAPRPTVELDQFRARREPLRWEDSLFYQMHNQLQGSTPKEIFGTKDRFWFVRYARTRAIDDGGPFRQSLTEISEELSAPHCPLFIQNTNHRTGAGPNHVVPNISQTSPAALAQYRRVGHLLAACLFSSLNQAGECVKLNLDLPPSVWKQLVGSPVPLSDLWAIDGHLWAALNGLSNLENTLELDESDEELAEEFIPGLEVSEHGTTIRLSDNSCRIVPVSFDKRRRDHIELVARARLEESSVQIDAIREGILEVLPIIALHLINWRDLELGTCGIPELPVARLRECIKFVGNRAAQENYFWLAMEKMTTAQRGSWCRFCTGQSRLPLSFTVHWEDPSSALPHANTCSRDVTIPAYTDGDMMFHKLCTACELSGTNIQDGTGMRPEDVMSPVS
eukprot:TRINITY_DN9195_c0_g1_i1.p1 TRINITY_DN9195_c0_g1~~TRINITY_DN9195_c0_g1_i1.p1  ORF type:complete len:3948 (-),score=457.59 TRINITY_DN9195_c0_g1_i1:42-11813(-)